MAGMTPTPLSAETLQTAISLFMLVGGLVLLLSLINGVLSIISFFRRPETIEKMLERYAEREAVIKLESDFKTDLASMEDRLDGRFKGLHESLVEERKSLSQITQDLNRAVGKLEGANAVAEAIKTGLKEALGRSHG